MAAFINKFREICGGSKALAYIIMSNVAIWLLLALAGGLAAITGSRLLNVISGGTWLALPGSFSLLLYKPWTIATYMLTQTSFLHLLFNMLWLYWFGQYLLFARGDRQLLSLYIGGGLAGALAFLITNAISGSAQGSYLVGASASVLAIMCADMIFMPDFRCRLFLIGEVPLKWLAAACILLTLLGEGKGSAGSLAAHCGGIIFGMLYAFEKRGVINLHRFREMLRKITNRRKKQTLRSRNLSKEYMAREKSADDFIKIGNNRLSDDERLDQLLDKIRISGYNSLSSVEKRELNAITKRNG